MTTKVKLTSSLWADDEENYIKTWGRRAVFCNQEEASTARDYLTSYLKVNHTGEGKEKFDNILSPAIFNNLHVANWIIRFNAISTLAISFPLYDSDIGAERSGENARQVNLIVERCGDDHPMVREAAIETAGKVLEQFWEILSSDSRMSLLAVLERSTRDRSCVSIRLAAVGAYAKLSTNLLASSALALALSRLSHVLHDPSPHVTGAMLAVVKEMVLTVSVESIAKQLLDNMMGLETFLSRLSYYRSRYLSHDMTEEQYHQWRDCLNPYIQFVLHTLYLEPTRTSPSRQAAVILELSKKYPLGILAIPDIIGKVLLDTPSAEKMVEEYVEHTLSGGNSNAASEEKSEPVPKAKAKRKAKAKATSTSSQLDKEIEENEKEDEEKAAENEDSPAPSAKAKGKRAAKKKAANTSKRSKIDVEKEEEARVMGKSLTRSVIWSEVGVAIMRSLTIKSTQMARNENEKCEENENDDEYEVENTQSKKESTVQNMHRKPSPQWFYLHVAGKIAAFLLKPIGVLRHALVSDPGSISLGPLSMSGKIYTLLKNVKNGYLSFDTYESIIQNGPLNDCVLDIMEALKLDWRTKEEKEDDSEDEDEDSTSGDRFSLNVNGTRMYKLICKSVKDAMNEYMMSCSESVMANVSSKINDCFENLIGLLSHPLIIRWGVTAEIITELLEKIHDLTPKMAVAAGVALSKDDVRLLDQSVGKDNSKINAKLEELRVKASSFAETCLVDESDNTCAILTRTACRCSVVEALVAIPTVRQSLSPLIFVGTAFSTRLAILTIHRAISSPFAKFPVVEQTINQIKLIPSKSEQQQQNSADSLDPLANASKWPCPFYDSALYALANRVARMGLRIFAHHQIVILNSDGESSSKPGKKPKSKAKAKVKSALKKNKEEEIIPNTDASNPASVPLLQSEGDYVPSIHSSINDLVHAFRNIDLDDVLNGSVFEENDSNEEKTVTDEQHDAESGDEDQKKKAKKFPKAKNNKNNKRVKNSESEIDKKQNKAQIWRTLAEKRPLSVVRGLLESVEISLDWFRLTRSIKLDSLEFREEGEDSDEEEEAKEIFDKILQVKEGFDNLIKGKNPEFKYFDDSAMVEVN
eukprot:GDKJ01019304.1.p1 GENE.GDKJ01019304.1~~GDKJ01019304.1.p1  ORF type:complete len:1096 (+),score=273.94 GDKJ01019304.1:6-3293(+)